LYYRNNNANAGDRSGTLGASFAKGFNDFYCMKYEVTESQWLAYFNSLTPNQKANRDLTNASHKNSDLVVDGNTISWNGSGTATTTAPDRAVNYISAADANSYMDWTGLRPMSELEYEKICRGSISPKIGEYAWGNANISTNIYNVSSAGLPNEMISNSETGIGNAIYGATGSGISRALRNGIFAASATNSTREESGGSYFGVMELSGNLYERCITVGTARGRTFTALHGNGIISSLTGNGTVPNWPNNASGDGYSLRGGSWNSPANNLRVSDRNTGAIVTGTASSEYGFRAARTAP
jgi:formylglycine-generating enzyme required for sulfatase activity